MTVAGPSHSREGPFTTLSGTATRRSLFAAASLFVLGGVQVAAYDRMTAAVVFLLAAAATAFEGATNRQAGPRATRGLVLLLVAILLATGLGWAFLVVPY